MMPTPSTCVLRRPYPYRPYPYRPYPYRPYPYRPYPYRPYPYRPYPYRPYPYRPYPYRPYPYRGAATGRGRRRRDGGKCHPPTLKHRGISYALVPPPPPFTTTFILIGWSPLHTHHRSSVPNTAI